MKGQDEKAWRRQFVQRLRLVLQVYPLRNTDVAEALNLAPQRVSNWVQALAVPRPYELARLCDRYGITAEYLLDGEVDHLPHWLAKKVLEGTR